MPQKYIRKLDADHTVNFEWPSACASCEAHKHEQLMAIWRGTFHLHKTMYTHHPLAVDTNPVRWNCLHYWNLFIWSCTWWQEVVKWWFWPSYIFSCFTFRFSWIRARLVLNERLWPFVCLCVWFLRVRTAQCPAPHTHTLNVLAMLRSGTWIQTGNKRQDQGRHIKYSFLSC